MRRDDFREMLRGYGLDDDKIATRVEGVELFETYLNDLADPVPLDECTVEHVSSFVAHAIDQGLNERGTFVGIYLYTRLIENWDVNLDVLDRLDGFEILGNMYRFVGDELGGDVRDEIFDGVELPPLGSTPLEWTRVNSVVLPRLESATDAATVKRILRSGLRDLPDEHYEPVRERYNEIGDIDAFLDDRGRSRVEELEQHRDDGTPYFNQMISDAVIDFVRATPQIGRGVRRGSTVFETKIPHQSIEYLAAVDLETQQYRACHCPVVKESMAGSDLPISEVFCEFCPVFHARPWEVIFGRKLEYDVLESAKRGADRCTFAIHLPEDAIPKVDGS